MKIMPGFTEWGTQTEKTGYALNIDQESLTSKNIEQLKLLLSTKLEEWKDWPINYIESITFLDESEHIVLRGNDMNQFILFSLPALKCSAVIDAFAREGIPATVIEQLDIDSTSLYP